MNPGFREPLACPCPGVGLVDIVGKKWAICVVTLIGANGPLPFGPIQRTLHRVSPATLTSTLRALEREGIVRRQTRAAGARSPHAYALTIPGQALYRSLLPLAS